MLTNACARGTRGRAIYTLQWNTCFCVRRFVSGTTKAPPTFTDTWMSVVCVRTSTLYVCLGDAHVSPCGVRRESHPVLCFSNTRFMVACFKVRNGRVQAPGSSRRGAPRIAPHASYVQPRPLLFCRNKVLPQGSGGSSRQSRGGLISWGMEEAGRFALS